MIKLLGFYLLVPINVYTGFAKIFIYNYAGKDLMSLFQAQAD